MMGIVIAYIVIYLFIFIVGACIGSFLNVCIYRLPTDESIVKGSSHCMSCKEKIKIRDLIPIISWCLLRGKCRNCGKKISPRYTFVETLTGLIFVFSFWYFDFINHPLTPTIYCLFFAMLIVIFFMDLDTQLINTAVVLMIGILAIARYFIISDLTILNHVYGALVIGVPFLLIVIISKERAMGLGDALLMITGGLFLGLKATIVATFIGLIIGSVAGLISKHKSGNSKFAFGPWLCIGLFAGAIYGTEIANMYLRFTGLIK